MSGNGNGSVFTVDIGVASPRNAASDEPEIELDVSDLEDVEGMTTPPPVPRTASSEDSEFLLVIEPHEGATQLERRRVLKRRGHLFGRIKKIIREEMATIGAPTIRTVRALCSYLIKVLAFEVRPFASLHVSMPILFQLSGFDIIDRAVTGVNAVLSLNVRGAKAFVAASYSCDDHGAWWVEVRKVSVPDAPSKWEGEWSPGGVGFLT